ncbi:hypothetical protein [Gilliamella sp. App2-1]|nr:hypothetical protein [Gilliamella apicola]
MSLVIKPILTYNACTTCDLEFNGKAIPTQTIYNSLMSVLAGLGIGYEL